MDKKTFFILLVNDLESGNGDMKILLSEYFYFLNKYFLAQKSRKFNIK